MNHMQKRTAWNKGTSRIKTVRGKYDFYKGSRWSPVAGLFDQWCFAYGCNFLDKATIFTKCKRMCKPAIIKNQ